MLYRCCFVHEKNRRTTLPPIQATSAEEAALIAAQSSHREAYIEVWDGADRVLVREGASSQVQRRRTALIY